VSNKQLACLGHGGDELPEVLTKNHRSTLPRYPVAFWVPATITAMAFGSNFPGKRP
jgi:hypothetical protein